MAMACDVTPLRPARCSARAILALAVLAGLVVMHGLGSSLDGMAVMSSSHSSTTTTTTTSMATSMTTPGAVDADVTAHVPGASARWDSACTQEHCLAALRPGAQLPAPVQVAAVGAPSAVPISAAVQQRLAMVRAPPPTARLTVLGVSRT
jgi:hypothetical protein